MDNRNSPGPRLIALGALFAAFLLLPGTVSAQTAELRGAVADSTGSALPGVTVTIVNAATGVERVVVTDDQGAFRVPALQPGPYTVESTLSGFGPDNRKVTLTVGQVGDVKVTLSVGAIEESIQVVGRAAVEIETTKSDLVGRRQPGTVVGTAGAEPRLRRPGAAAARRRPGPDR